MINVSTENGFEYDLDTIVVDGELFKHIGYDMLKTANVMTYVESPSRSNSGAMYIEEMDSFIVPQCEVGFKLMKTEQFSAFRRLLLERKEHVVNYYDVDFGDRVTHRMYVEPDSLKGFFARGTKVIGVQNYTVTFIGLNTDDEVYTVSYDPNGGSEVDVPNYRSNKQYYTGDVVIKGGVYYRCVKTPSSAIEDPDPTDPKYASYWEQVDASVFYSDTTVEWGNSIMVEDCEGIYAPPKGKSSFLYYVNKIDENGEAAVGAWRYYPDQSLSVFRNTTLFAIWG